MDAEQATKLVESLFASWYSTLVRYALRWTGHLESAEDFVQQVFLLLYQELRQGKPVENPKGWTLCVLRREIQKHIRTCARESLEPAESFDLLPGSLGPDDPGLGPGDVAKLFSVLTKREEEVILLRLQSLKYREIATQLGISPKSVNTLLARALRKLQRAALEKPSGCTGRDHVEEYAPKSLQ